jgi:2-polyprenyl-3-methyl-5-hydroxy-6-metoxy-1,4-benzoquinol methylase
MVNYFSRTVRRMGQGKLRREMDALYGLLYQIVHDLDASPSLAAVQTRAAFTKQWQHLKDGQYLLSDPWFKNNVARILSEQEIQIQPEWFAGKEVLDAGCGNGRWSYGLAKLGAHVTAVDASPVAIKETRDALAEFTTPRHFAVTPLENVASVVPEGKTFDLVFCWGVAHHCQRFSQVLDELTRLVKDGGLLYLYLYGRESLPFKQDLALFKERVAYNALPTEAEKYGFLLARAGGDHAKVHNLHDIYAPLINRRFTFDQVKDLLHERGLTRIERTIDHSELFIRCLKGSNAGLEQWLLPKATAPYWFQHHDVH